MFGLVLSPCVSCLCWEIFLINVEHTVCILVVKQGRAHQTVKPKEQTRQ